MQVQHYQLLGELDPVLPWWHSAGMVSTACLKLLLHGVLLLPNPQMWLCWQSSSVQKPELNIPSCHVPYTSQDRISCSRNRSNTLGHHFQSKSIDPVCKQYLVCLWRDRGINQSMYLSQSASPILYQLLKWSNIHLQSVIKGQPLLQPYIRLTPLDLPPLLCFYHIWPSVTLYHTHSVRKHCCQLERRLLQMKDRNSAAKGIMPREIPPESVFLNPHVTLFQNLKSI